MSEEEIAIETLKEVASDDFDTLGDDISPKMAQNILNLIKKQDNKIKFLLDDEKSLKEMNRNQMNIIEKQQKEIEEYQKCFEDIERHQKNQMQMQKELWKRLKGETND